MPNMRQPFLVVLKQSRRLAGANREEGATLGRGETKDGLSASDLRKALLCGHIDIVAPNQMAKGASIDVQADLTEKDEGGENGKPNGKDGAAEGEKGKKGKKA